MKVYIEPRTSWWLWSCSWSRKVEKRAMLITHHVTLAFRFCLSLERPHMVTCAHL